MGCGMASRSATVVGSVLTSQGVGMASVAARDGGGGEEEKEKGCDKRVNCHYCRGSEKNSSAGVRSGNSMQMELCTQVKLNEGVDDTCDR